MTWAASQCTGYGGLLLLPQRKDRASCMIAPLRCIVARQCFAAATWRDLFGCTLLSPPGRDDAADRFSDTARRARLCLLKLLPQFLKHDSSSPPVYSAPTSQRGPSTTRSTLRAPTSRSCPCLRLRSLWNLPAQRTLKRKNPHNDRRSAKRDKPIVANGVCYLVRSVSTGRFEIGTGRALRAHIGPGRAENPCGILHCEGTWKVVNLDSLSAEQCRVLSYAHKWLAGNSAR